MCFVPPGCTQRDYVIKDVDAIVEKIIENQNAAANIKSLLEYGETHDIDASFSLHYYASLYYVYSKHPKDFVNYGQEHKKTVSKVLREGKKYFDEYYPNGYK